jgi:hypothetical protein
LEAAVVLFHATSHIRQILFACKPIDSVCEVNALQQIELWGIKGFLVYHWLGSLEEAVVFLIETACIDVDSAQVGYCIVYVEAIGISNFEVMLMSEHLDDFVQVVHLLLGHLFLEVVVLCLVQNHEHTVVVYLVYFVQVGSGPRHAGLHFLLCHYGFVPTEFVLYAFQILEKLYLLLLFICDSFGHDLTQDVFQWSVPTLVKSGGFLVFTLLIVII